MKGRTDEPLDAHQLKKLMRYAKDKETQQAIDGRRSQSDMFVRLSDATSRSSCSPNVQGCCKREFLEDWTKVILKYAHDHDLAPKNPEPIPIRTIEPKTGPFPICTDLYNRTY